MPRTTSFPGIETDYPAITTIPDASEMHIVADGEDYNITLPQLATYVSDGIDGYTTGAEVAAALDSYLGSAVWRAGAGEFDAVLLDEDDFISDSDEAAPTQQSTKAYITTRLAAATFTATQVSDSTAAGRSMLTAANAAAQRTLLNVEDGATADQTAAEIVTALETLTSTDRLLYTAVDGLDAEGAGDLYATALIAAAGLGAGDILRVNSGATAFEPLEVEATSPVPTAATSTAGAITLDFDLADTITTTTTEAITAITVSNLELYERGAWRVTNTTARNITFPSTWRVPTSANPTFTGTADATVWFTIWRSGTTTYDVTIGDELTVVS
jgi:hypothetical protein